MRISDRCLAASTFALTIAIGGFATAQAPRRVDTPTALAQIVKKVDPVVPPEAAKANVGGVVVADVVIGPAGTVSSVSILSGHMLLHAAAERAMRQWTLKPFLAAGRPIAVQVILEVSFPDPVKEAENRIFERHRASKYACDRQLEADAAKAEEACAAAVRDTDALPPDRVLERGHAVASHAQSLMAAGRTRDAIAQFERVNEIRATRVKGPDAGAADVYQILGVLHQQVGEHAKADAAFATAIAMYTAAQERLPQMSDRYAPRLQLALTRYAALKRAAGDAAGAAALDARAAKIRASPEPPPSDRAVRSIRTAGDLQISEPPDGRLTDDDLRQIRSLLARDGKAWRIDLMVGVARGAPTWSAYASLEPDVATRAFRRGRCAYLTTAPEPGSRETPHVWRRVEGGNCHYIQERSARRCRRRDCAVSPARQRDGGQWTVVELHGLGGR